MRKLAKRLAELGFRRSKSSFFIRQREHVIEFIHLHKYSFGPEFRVHLGLRVLNDPFEAVALNGIDSHAYVCRNSPSGKRYDLSYQESEESLERCAKDLYQFCAEVGETWFLRWRNLGELIRDSHSPLGGEAKRALANALDGKVQQRYIEVTRQLLAAS
jgi:hypothetical protein